MKNEECIEGNDGRFLMDYSLTYWTVAARECEARGCECEGCNLVPDWFISRCKMKKCVEELNSDKPRVVDNKYDRDEIERIYRPKGKSITDVALHYHISPGTMKGIMRTLGIVFKGRGMRKKHVKK